MAVWQRVLSKLILPEFRTNKGDPNRSCLFLCCGTSLTSLYTMYLLSFGKLSYWSLLYPQQWQCWTSTSGRSGPASQLALWSFYPDQQELKFPKYEETEQECLTQRILAPPFGHQDELKFKNRAKYEYSNRCSDCCGLVVMCVCIYIYIKFSLTKKEKTVGSFYFFHTKMTTAFPVLSACLM